MPIRSVWLGLNFEEAALENIEESYACETYAVELCIREQAHLSVLLAAPVFKIPGVIPGAGLLAGAAEDEVNANRHARAEEAQGRIASAVKSASISAEFHIAQESYSQLGESLSASAGPSDIIVLSRPGCYLALDRKLIEAMLFTSGRPIVLVPPKWARGARLEKVIVAWDGSGRAARAVGEAMPLLARSDEVEIVSVSADASKKSIPSTNLLAHLTRHCRKVVAADLPMQPGGIAETLRAHAVMARANLLVMGGYAHTRMLETVLGGVTRDMLAEAELPVLLSH